MQNYLYPECASVEYVGLQKRQTNSGMLINFISFPQFVCVSDSQQNVVKWNVTPLLGDFGGIVGYCGIL